jgi:hypothetical protein
MPAKAGMQKSQLATPFPVFAGITTLKAMDASGHRFCGGE